MLYCDLKKYEIEDISIIEYNKHEYEIRQARDNSFVLLGSVWIGGGYFVLICGNQIIYTQEVNGWDGMTDDEKISIFKIALFWLPPTK